LSAGFGAVLADDMGLGKTVQTLALLQARREAGRTGAALLIVPTSLLHGWQVQAAQFAPELRLLISHGPDRKALRGRLVETDLVITTYP
ncbi:SNF2-related protein, partial [Bacillus thuringiensis]|uniref:SNF2-related protein n=1 Tax=Bacillus thuringiensis TaxID=1428 RepID=UPI003F536E81